MLKLYNSLSKKTESFKPIKKGQVGLYTCGPTVYDHVHIGNLRTYIFEDTLRRVLRASGYKVKHVMNITDVDDKTIARAKQLYPKLAPSAALAKLTERYTSEFLEDANAVGIELSDSKLVKATQHIDSMQKLILDIPNRYTEPDGVYFDITKYKDYGVFTKLDSSHTHHRIDNDEYDKEHVADFALWKAGKPDEPTWDFELDGQNMPGRPGWHIECSAMSSKYLGQPFDIHTGGVDLKFPHHENEIAQSKSASGKDLANFWLHGEHLLVNGQKMAKSAKNFYTLKDIVDKGFHPLAFRLLVLQAHYRKQLNFTWSSLASAQEFLQRLYAWSDLQFQTLGKHQYSAGEAELLKYLQQDLGSPQAVARLSALAKQAEAQPPKPESLIKLLKAADKLLGLGLSERLDIGSEQKTLITKREEARQRGDYAASDTIRDELKSQGIGLNDNSYGVSWYRLI